MANEIAAPGPRARIDPQLEARVAATGRVVTWIAGVYTTLAAAGVWVEAVRGLLPSGPVPVRGLPATAGIPLALLAWSTVLVGDMGPSARISRNRRLARLLGTTVSVFGVVLGAVHLLGSGLPWGGLEHLASPWAVLILVVLGAAVPLSLGRTEAVVIAGQVGALGVLSAAAVVLLGYLYGDVSVGRLFGLAEISFDAVVAALLVATGLFLSRPRAGLLAAASGAGAGGRLLRRFGPVALFLPALLLFVVESVPTEGRVDAIAMVSVGLGLFLLILMSVVVRVIDETRSEAQAASAQAERARAGLEQEAPLVRSLSEALHIVDVAEGSGVEVAKRFRPGQGSVAGDASAIRTLPDGTIGAVLVDLTGHGADPALRAIRVRDLLVHSLAHGSSPAEAMALVGWAAPGDVLASAVAIKLDPRSGQAVVASAGHPPAVWLRRDQTRLLGPTGPLLYLDPESTYRDETLELAEGDTLVMLSDGVVDVQREREGRPEPAVIAELLLSRGGGGATRTADLAIDFAEPEPSDDQTVLVVRLGRRGD